MKKSILTLSVLTALSMSNAFAQDATYQGAAVDAEIANTCIVRFNDDISKFDVTGKARGMVARANAQAKHIYKNTIKGMAVNMSCDKAKQAFAGDDGIMRFTPDGKVYANPAAKKGKPGGGGSGPQETRKLRGGPVDGSATQLGY